MQSRDEFHLGLSAAAKNDNMICLYEPYAE